MINDELVKSVSADLRAAGFDLRESSAVPPGTVLAVATGEGVPPRFANEQHADYILRLARLGYAAHLSSIANDMADTARQERRVHQFGGKGDGELAGTFDAAGFWHCVRCGVKSYRYEPKGNRIVLKHREVKVYIPAATAGVEMDCPKCGARNQVTMR